MIPRLCLFGGLFFAPGLAHAVDWTIYDHAATVGAIVYPEEPPNPDPVLNYDFGPGEWNIDVSFGPAWAQNLGNEVMLYGIAASSSNSASYAFTNAAFEVSASTWAEVSWGFEGNAQPNGHSDYVYLIDETTSDVVLSYSVTDGFVRGGFLYPLREDKLYIWRAMCTATKDRSGASYWRIRILNPAIGCPADLDGSGVLNVDDVDLFVNAFLSDALFADLDGNGELNVDDIDAFVTAFLLGCP